MTTTVGEAFVEIRPSVNRAKFSSDLNKALSGQEISNVGTKAGQTVGKGIEEETSKASERAGSKMEQRFNTATSKVGGSFGKLGGLLESQFGLPFAGVLDTIGSKIEQVETKGQGLSGIFKNIGKGATVAGVAGFGLIAGEAIHLADTYELVHARLEVAIKNTGGDIEKLDPIIQKQIDHFAKLGINQTEYEKALSRLVTATKDPQKALAYMGEVADIAAFSGKDLTSSAVLLGKVLQGQTGPLKRFGIDLGISAGGAGAAAKATAALAKAQADLPALQDDVARSLEKVNVAVALNGENSKQARTAYGQYLNAQEKVDKKNAEIADSQKKANDAMDTGGIAAKALGERLQGVADKQAETFAGKLKGMKAELENVGIKIGLFLIPWIEKLIGAIQDTIKWFEQHKQIAEALAIAIGTVLVVAIGAWVAAMVTAAATTILAMAPVLVVIATIGLLIADGILLWQRFGGTIQSVINDTIIPAINLFVDGVNVIIDALNAIPLAGFNILHVGHVGELGGGGGFNSSGGVGSTPYGPPLAGGSQYSVPIGPGLPGSGFNYPTAPNYGGSGYGYADGGWVTGAPGAPQLAIVHGGEFVVSRDMQRQGSQKKRSNDDGRHYHFHYDKLPKSQTQLVAETDASLRALGALNRM